MHDVTEASFPIGGADDSPPGTSAEYAAAITDEEYTP